MIDFFVFYFLLLLFGSLIIVGWFLISRGEIKIQPDGTEKKTGLLFKSWQLFWEQKKGEPEMIQYTGKQLYDFKRELIQTAKQEGYTGTFMFMDNFVLTTTDIKPYVHTIEYQIRGIKIHCYRNEPEVIHEKSNASCRLTIYKKEDVYLFPEWLQDMMAGCVTCHASFYGSIIFWSAIGLFGRDIFSVFTHQTVGVILTWFSYCFSLAFLNTFLYKHLNKH